MATVTLLACTPEPEKLVAAAAKLCYSPSSIETIREGLTEEKTSSFVQMLAEITPADVARRLETDFDPDAAAMAVIRPRG